MNVAMIRYMMAWVLRLEGLAMLLPTLCGLIYCEDTTWALAWVAVGAILLGYLLGRRRPENTVFYAREGFVTVAACWILLSLVGALPFWLTGMIPNFIDAVFEITSGFTTTGSSILPQVEYLGHALLFWRSFSHWLGGMGVLVLVLTVLPLGGGYNMAIMRAESPGPDVSKMVPHVADTAKALYKIYLALSLVMMAAFLLSGMAPFDALCIGFGTAGTGGFAVRDTGMADYDSVSQVLITLFMILFGMNFQIFYLLQKKRWKEAVAHEEVRLYLLLILGATLFLSVCVYREMGGQVGFVVQQVFFTVASIFTSTGYSTLNFAMWSQPAQMVILFLMAVGACAGSTGGGFKVSRFVILLKEARRELYLIIHPQAIRIIRFEGRPLSPGVIGSVTRYLVLYLVIFTLSVFLISFDGHDFMTNFSAVLANLNNIGPGLSEVGPTKNFGIYSNFSKGVLIFDMIAGRLEILPILILLSPKTWKKHH